MSESESPPSEVYDALDRLYDNPDERVAALLALAGDADEIDAQTTEFKTLANADRLRILHALRDSECCGCELQVVLDAPQSTVSTHLRKLKQAGLVKSRKKGKWSYYRIADTEVFEVLDLAAATQEVA